MKRTSWFGIGTGAALLLVGQAAEAQTFAKEDRVLRAIWEEGTARSQVEALSQALMDSIGPRLTGTPEHKRGNDWLVSRYTGWGIAARNQQYGTWLGWRRGLAHVDLVQPRVRSLEATMLAWSPGTGGREVEGAVVALPEVADSAAFAAWLPQVRGKFVMISYPEPTCRPDDNWEKWALAETFAKMKREREAGAQAWVARMRRTGVAARDLPARLEAAGAAGVLTSYWSDGWGVQKVFRARTQRVPTFDVSCEDYGLLYRLAEKGQGPVVRVRADAEFQGEVPVFNTIAEIRGREKPNEYVILSAHFDTWDAASGATDNGTGTVTMMEAMRILKQVYPNPRRTILVGHWSGEEQGLNGSRGFVADNPRVVQGAQAVFNQDNGTGRIANIGMQGFTAVGPIFQQWVARLPREISQHIQLDIPGTPGGGGSDYASFVCAGAPAFNLSSLGWDYGTYTWHTNRDTYDKISFDDVRNNAVLTAMLAYMAAEEPQKLSRARLATLPPNPNTGQPRSWPTCVEPARSYAQSTR